jgi:hypothetical protein
VATNNKRINQSHRLPSHFVFVIAGCVVLVVVVASITTSYIDVMNSCCNFFLLDIRTSNM